MPSPVGHAIGGMLVGLILARRGRLAAWGLLAHRSLGGGGGLGQLGVLAVVACLPDLDFLWGRHNMETHSLGAAVLAGLAVLAWTRGRNRRLAMAVTLAWSTHVLFDWLGSDDTPPLGVMAMWPITSTFYFADAFVFEAISRRYWLENFYSHNLSAVLREVLLLGPIAAFLYYLRRKSQAVSRKP